MDAHVGVALRVHFHDCVIGVSDLQFVRCGWLEWKHVELSRESFAYRIGLDSPALQLIRAGGTFLVFFSQGVSTPVDSSRATVSVAGSSAFVMISVRRLRARTCCYAGRGPHSPTCSKFVSRLNAPWLPKAKPAGIVDRKSTRLNSSHVKISYAVFCLKKKTPSP